MSFSDPKGKRGVDPTLLIDLIAEGISYLFGESVSSTAERIGEQIGIGLQGKTGNQGCIEACLEKCLKLVDRANPYYRDDVYFGCVGGCRRTCC